MEPIIALFTLNHGSALITCLANAVELLLLLLLLGLLLSLRLLRSALSLFLWLGRKSKVS